MAWTNKAILDDAGQVAEILAIGANITAQKRAEEALDKAKELYRSVFDNAALGIDVVDDKGKFLQVNKAFANMLGYSQEELLTLTIFDITHPEDVKDSQYRYQTMQQGKTEAYQFDKRYIRKDGEVLYANLSVTAVRDPDGGHKATIGVIADITRRKAAEAERERLSRAIEQAAEAVVITEVDGTIHYVNPAFEKITGYAAREAIGQNPRLLKSGEHDTHFYAELWNTIKAGGIWSGRFTNRRKDGSLYHEDATISPVKDSLGQIVNFVAVKRAMLPNI